MIAVKTFIDGFKIFTLVEIIIIFLLSLIQINLLFALGINDPSLYLKALKAILYLIPQIFFITSPFALFLSTMILLSDYRKSKRIIVMQTLGFSNFQIIKPFLLLAFALLLFNYFLLFALIPQSSLAFKNLQKNIQSENLLKFLEIKAIKQIIPEVFLYLEGKEEGLLQGIFLLDNRNDITKIFTAKTGLLSDKGIELNQGFYQELRDKQVKVIATFDRYLLPLEQKILPKPREIHELSIYELKNYSGDKLNKARFFFHQKLSWPLYLFVFLALILKWDWYYNYSGNFARLETGRVWIAALGIFLLINLLYFFLQNFYFQTITLYLLYFLGPCLLQFMSLLLKLRKKCSLSSKIYQTTQEI